MQSVVGYMGQAKAARAQNQRFRQNHKSAINAYQDDIEAMNLNAIASNEDAAQRRMETRLEAMAARSSARVGAGERGLGGYSAMALEQDVFAQEGRAVSAIDRNLQLDEQRFRLQGRGAANTAESRINSMRRAAGPSTLGLIANLGSAAVQGFSMQSNLSANQAARAAANG